jgi:acetyl-CoA C-acetyltransferase
MALDPRTPVIIGIGQHLNRVDQGAEAVEPAALMAEALREAATDAGAGRALSALDVIAVVPPISWRYYDPGRLVAASLGAGSARSWMAGFGGNSPQMLVNKLAAAIAAGELELGAVVGGESWWTRSRALKSGATPPWPHQPDSEVPEWSGAEGPLTLFHASEAERGIVAPAECYPIFETALWHESGRSLDEHLAFVGDMWSRFSEVAAANPYAWRRDAYRAEEITTPTAENRMISFPYTKRMVANPDVEMAAGCLIASVERAESLGVPRERWVFIHAGTDGNDRYMSERPNFTSSPAISVAGNRALELAGVAADQLDHVDLYSCFPSAVQIACKELAIDPSRQLTVYGGLGFAGGPWNNPVSHAIARMVPTLREQPGAIGLVTANGGNVQKHAFGVYSTDPPTGGFRHERPQEEIDARGSVEVEPTYLGPVTIEGWTVVHGRDGVPEKAHAATRTPHGTRVWGSVSDAKVATDLEGPDLGGVTAMITESGQLSLS